GLGEVPDGRAPPIVMTSDRKHELVLRGGHAHRDGLLLAPPEEATEAGAELQEPGVVVVAERARRRQHASRAPVPESKNIVPRHNWSSCSRPRVPMAYSEISRPTPGSLSSRSWRRLSVR